MGAVAVIIGGTLWHFAYDLSGGNRAVAAIAPANESVWEHLKLVLLPVIALGAVEAIWIADRRRLWWAKLVEVVAASAFIVAVFYTYTGAAGVPSILAADALTFVAAIGGGQWMSYRIITSPTSPAPRTAVSVTVLVLLVVGYGVLTFAPPDIPLFREIGSGVRGPA